MELAPARKHSACTASPICWRPADRRTRARGMVMRATAMVRTNSNGSSGAWSASGVPLHAHQVVDRHRLGVGLEVGQLRDQAGALQARLAHADDAAAADLDAGAAHARQRVEAVLVVARGDDVAVEVGRAVQVVVVVVQAGVAQRLGMAVFQHAQRGAGFQAQRLHGGAPARPPSRCRGPWARARPRPCRSASRRRPSRAARLAALRPAPSAWRPRRRCRSVPPAGSSRSPRGSRRS